jgi:hypothetical protein
MVGPTARRNILLHNEIGNMRHFIMDNGVYASTTRGGVIFGAPRRLGLPLPTSVGRANAKVRCQPTDGSAVSGEVRRIRRVPRSAPSGPAGVSCAATAGADPHELPGLNSWPTSAPAGSATAYRSGQPADQESVTDSETPTTTAAPATALRHYLATSHPDTTMRPLTTLGCVEPYKQATTAGNVATTRIGKAMEPLEG